MEDRTGVGNDIKKEVGELETRYRVSMLGANVIYFLTAILLLTVGSYVQYQDIKKGLLFTEYVLVLLPPLIYLCWKREKKKQFLRIKPLKGLHVILVISITILSYPVALFFNILFLAVFSLFGPIEQMPIPTPSTFSEYLLLMGIIAVSAGICEEIFFRGFFMRTYERLGKKKAIWFSALLFGLFHFNIQNFAGPVVLGVIFGYLVYETDSLFSGIIGHITNNGLAMTISFLGNIYLKNNSLPDSNAVSMPEPLQLIGSAFLIGIIALIAGTGAYFLFRILRQKTIRTKGFERMQPVWVEERFPKLKYLPVLLTIILYGYVSFLQISG